MKRRRILIAGGLAPCLFSHGGAQERRIPSVGWLSLRDISRAHPDSARIDAFYQGLISLGYEEGRNIIIERRSAEGKVGRLPELAAELVQLKVDVLLALEPPAVEAAKAATSTIPIVMRSSDDPVELGWVASLAHPGGNVTGVTSYAHLLHGKRIQLLRETIPGLSRIAVMYDPGGPATAPSFRRIESDARKIGIAVHPLAVRTPNEFGTAVEEARKKRAGAILVLRGPVIVEQRRLLAELAARGRIAVIYDDREFVEVGGMMSYGANLADSYRRAAFYVDRILKGARPGDLPVEQPTTFELLINLKAARLAGVSIPQSLLLRADRVIE